MLSRVRTLRAGVTNASAAETSLSPPKVCTITSIKRMGASVI